MKSFKTKWNEVDELCPHCNNITKKAQGLTKQNLKNLIWGKVEFVEWVIFFIIIMTLFMAWAYNHDISQCREVVENIDSICLTYQEDMINRENFNNNSYQNINVSNLYVIQDEIQER